MREKNEKVSFAVLCHRRGTTAEEVAKKLGIATSSLRARLSGRGSLRKLREIADVLDVDVSELI